MSNSVDLSKYTMSDSDRHQLESLRSEIESRIELTPVLEYLKLKEILTHDRIAQLKQLDGTEAKSEFVSMLQRCGPKAFECFCASLEHSGQLTLLKSLKPDWQDGNCVGAIHKPTDKEIEANERYYSVEKRVYTEIPQTKGELDLKPSDCRDSVESIKSKYVAAEVYPNFSKPKGLALIINNRDFYGPKEDPLPDRLGTDVDAKNSVKLWKNLGYDVKLVENLTGEKILKELVKFAIDDHHDNCDSAIVVILSHGQHGGIYGVDGHLVQIDRLVTCLNAQNCRALRNKPKLMILQACRGERYDPGHMADQSDGNYNVVNSNLEAASVESILSLLNEMDLTDAKNLQDKIPTEADILICYATTPGFVSWRNSARGSWFIQSICEIFQENAHKRHVLDMLTMVNRRVAEVFISSSGHKQMPEPCSRLTKDFYIFPGVYQ